MQHLSQNLMSSTVIFFVILVQVSIYSQSLGQSNTLALNHLEELRVPTVELSNHFLAYTKLVLLQGHTKKTIRAKASLLYQIRSAEKTILAVKNFNGQTELKNQYLQYYIAMEKHLNSLPEIEIEEVEIFNLDSAKKHQVIQIEQLGLFLSEAKNLKFDLEKFCILNKVIGNKTSGALYAEQKEAIKLISFAVQVKNSLMNIRRLNRLFFTSLSEDTGQNANWVRTEIIKESAFGIASLQAIPNFPGDRKVKKSALNNIMLTKMHASKEYLSLVNFRIQEIAFKKKNLSFIQSSNETALQKETHGNEIKKFESQIKLNRIKVKTFNQARVKYENSFNTTFLNFIENQLSVDPISSDQVVYKKMTI